ncbi:MAG: cupin, partial [Paenibacillus sp.]|nr:cupin [Paenibacillus sp.]
ISYMDYTSPNVQFAYDVNNSLFFKKDSRNYINVLSINQLNTLGNVSLLDIYLSTGNVVEPHIHQNASELVYCISGAAVVSLVNPFTKELLNFPIQPGQAANVPQGWWHYEVASVDNTHLLAIFDAPIPEFIGGSDLLRLTPASVLAHTYCLDEAQVKETLAPITKTVFIGPPSDCKTEQVEGKAAANPMASPAANPATYPAVNPLANPAFANPGYYNPPAYGYQPRQNVYWQQQPVIGNGWYYNN